MKIDKIDAAYRQINTAIFLFFQDYDPVSVHTLVGAALQILNDHIKDTNIIYSNYLFTHYDTIFAKEEKRKELHKILMKHRNFFKHAKDDPYAQTDFNPDINEFFILDAIRTYEVLTKIETKQNPIFVIFTFWFIINNQNLVCDDKINDFNAIKEQIRLNGLVSGYDIRSKHDCYEVIKYMIENKITSFDSFIK